MIVKVCGMRDADNIRAVESLGVNWMGFIFYGPSSRNVESLPSYLPQDANRVGVFVDEDPLTVSIRVKQFGLDMVQLHGSYRGTVPFILSGGIGPDDAGRVNGFSHPMMAGIDLNSRFESSPALKDVESLKSFLSQIKNLNS